MRLGDIREILPVSVQRDGEFATLGMISDSNLQMLTYLDNVRFVSRMLQNPGVVSVITTGELAEAIGDRYGVALSANPKKDFFRLHNYLAESTDFYWSDFASEISPNAVIHSDAYIAPKNVRISEGAVVEPRVTILERTIIDSNVTLRAGCTVGAHGLEIKRFGNELISVAHAGAAHLHDHAEVNANSVIQCAVYGGATEISDDVKLGVLVNIGHNVKIGSRSIIAGCVIISGSTFIGDDVWIGPGAVICNGLHIGHGARVLIGSVVINDVAPNERVSGNFAISHRKFAAFMNSIR